MLPRRNAWLIHENPLPIIMSFSCVLSSAVTRAESGMAESCLLLKKLSFLAQAFDNTGRILLAETETARSSDSLKNRDKAA